MPTATVTQPPIKLSHDHEKLQDEKFKLRAIQTNENVQPSAFDVDMVELSYGDFMVKRLDSGFGLPRTLIKRVIVYNL